MILEYVLLSYSYFLFKNEFYFASFLFYLYSKSYSFYESIVKEEPSSNFGDFLVVTFYY